MVTIPGNVWYTYKPEPENPKEDGCIVPTPTPSSSDEWVRPADRPPLPWGEGELTEDNTIYMLFGVTPNAPNDYAILLQTTASHTFQAYWGDGTNNSSSGGKAEHIFDYETLDVEPNTEGIKWVWMKFVPTDSTDSFKVINTNVRHSLRPVGSSSNSVNIPVYEIYLRATNVASWSWSSSMYNRFSLLNIFSWYGTNKLTTFIYFLNESYSLRSLLIDTSNGQYFGYFLKNCHSFNQQLNINTSNGISFINFLENCYSFNQLLNIDMSNGQYFGSFLKNCYSFNQPLDISVNNSIDFSSFLENCYSFNQSLSIDTSKNIKFNNFLFGCYSFNQPLNIDTSNGTDFGYFLRNCYSFNQPLNIDTSKGTNFGYFLQGCRNINSITIDLMSNTMNISGFIGADFSSLKSFRILNMNTPSLNSITVSNSNMTADALTLLFNDLYDRTSLANGTITITNSYGASKLTTEQRAIAISKKWNIVG